MILPGMGGPSRALKGLFVATLGANLPRSPTLLLVAEPLLTFEACPALVVDCPMAQLASVSEQIITAGATLGVRL